MRRVAWSVRFMLAMGLAASAVGAVSPPWNEASQGTGGIGSLDLRIHPAPGETRPAGELMLIDPGGLRTGATPAGERLEEIPGSSYELQGLDDAVSGEPGPRTAVLYVHDARAGDYELLVSGSMSGSYELEARALDRDLRPTDVRLAPREIQRGETQCYRVRLPDRAGAAVIVEATTRCLSVFP